MRAHAIWPMLLPIAREYDPTAAFSVGADMDPRFEITARGC